MSAAGRKIVLPESGGKKRAGTEKAVFSIFLEMVGWTIIDDDKHVPEENGYKNINEKTTRKRKRVRSKPNDSRQNKSQTTGRTAEYLGIEELDRLDWTDIPFSESTPFIDDAAGGYTALEEIDDVEVIFEKNAGGNIVKFRVSITNITSFHRGYTITNANRKFAMIMSRKAIILQMRMIMPVAQMTSWWIWKMKRRKVKKKIMMIVATWIEIRPRK